MTKHCLYNSQCFIFFQNLPAGFLPSGKFNTNLLNLWFEITFCMIEDVTITGTFETNLYLTQCFKIVGHALPGPV